MANDEKINWHLAFCQAIEMELAEYKDQLLFNREYQLTAEPLRIDVVIITKQPGIQIDKNVGKIFMGHNIIEYKNPNDSLNIYDYYKILGYAYFYAYLNKIGTNDITISQAKTYGLTR